MRMHSSSVQITCIAAPPFRSYVGWLAIAYWPVTPLALGAAAADVATNAAVSVKRRLPAGAPANAPGTAGDSPSPGGDLDNARAGEADPPAPAEEEGGTAPDATGGYGSDSTEDDLGEAAGEAWALVEEGLAAAAAASGASARAASRWGLPGVWGASAAAAAPSSESAASGLSDVDAAAAAAAAAGVGVHARGASAATVSRRGLGGGAAATVAQEIG